MAAAGALSGQNQAQLRVGWGKSIVVDSAVDIKRVSVANPDMVEALGISPREVLVNGKQPGETTLIVWQDGGSRQIYDVSVDAPNTLLETVRAKISQELPGQDVTVTADREVVFVQGTVNDVMSSNRAMAIAATLGKPVNLLHVNVPPGEQQILLKVKFADVDRTVSQNLGFNLFSTGATNTIGGVTTQQFSPPSVTWAQNNAGTTAQAAISNALNVLLYRPDLNLGATIAALEAHNVLEILAEPNVLAINGKEASFLAGGEFPYPTVQGGSIGGALAITIQFKEFGIKLKFTPTVTPRGTIRLLVAPEVSSLDYSNGLTYQGFSIPALSTRRVQTEIELESGQSFAIAGLLDNSVTEILSKVPGLGDVPVLGKLFQSRQRSKAHSELLVLVTPELVRPIPAGGVKPELEFPKGFVPGASTQSPRTPGMDVTGPVPVTPPVKTIPIEQLLGGMQVGQAATPAAAPAPVPNQVSPEQQAPAKQPTAAPNAPASPTAPAGEAGAQATQTKPPAESGS
jgi:pilus assembly protein CpaC